MQINHHVGLLVREPKFYIRGEKQMQIAYFSLAINERKDSTATFVEYIAFDKTAELVNKLLTKKGQVVEVDFKMRNHNFVDNETGHKRYEIQNVVSTFRTYGGKKNDKENSQEETEKSSNDNRPSENDIPPYPNFNDLEIDYFGG
ncbi:single-stranded DNA-binding protein [Leuconostoc citreum]|uniref:single-stranded DNA-binding protein n=1 Tax=Leuconostoc citreum TaxID=33964 RepID=UPI0032DE3A30